MKPEIFRVIFADNLVFLKTLLNENPELARAKDKNGYTPLHVVRKTKNTKDIIKLLLAFGADINAIDNSGSTPLYSAAYEGNKVAVTTLIAHGANINARKNNGWTALHAAATEAAAFFAGDDEAKAVVEMLIASGADVHSKDNNGRTPLSWTKDYGTADIAELLRKHGATE